jgi:cytochrome c biogenesis protein ResB
LTARDWGRQFVLPFRLLGSLELSLALLGLLALAAMAGGTLPQTGRLSPAELNAWQSQWPSLSLWLHRLGLSGVYASWWFLTLCLVLLVNLVAGMAAHVLYMRAWRGGKTAPAFCLKGELPVPAALARRFSGLANNAIATQTAGMWGTPLFHAGIAVIIVGAMFGASERFAAHFEVAEGELFAGQKEKLLTERGSVEPKGDLGILLRLDRLHVEIDQGKYLRELQAVFTVREATGTERVAVLEVNSPLKLGPYALYLDKTVGVSAVFDRILADGSRRRLLVNFPVSRADWGKGRTIARSEMVMLDNRPIHFRMALTPGEPPSFRLTAERRGETVFDGTLAPNQAADLGPYRLVFLGTVPWVGLYIAAGGAEKAVFAGFVIALGGLLLQLLLRPRRLWLVEHEGGWELQGWALRDDWRFEAGWRRWQAGEGRGDPP